MNKNELAESVAAEAGISKSDASKALDATFSRIGKALKDGEEVRLKDFGTFSVQHRPARAGRNPKTGEALTVEAQNVPKFKPAKGLKDAV